MSIWLAQTDNFRKPDIISIGSYEFIYRRIVGGDIMGIEKKKYSADELLSFAYKHNKVPAFLFAKDRDGRYIYSSMAGIGVNGGKQRSVIGRTDMDIQHDQRLGREYYEQDKDIMKTGKSCQFYIEIDQNGKKIYRKVSKNVVYANGKVIGVCGMVSDITELMNLKNKFETLTFYDKLTGVYNRNYMQKVDFNKEEYMPCAYIMCDCNDLKGVNDSRGHSEGDKYIQNTASILKETMPSNGICIRYGGDEFLAIIPGCDEYQCRDIVEKINARQEAKKAQMPYMDVAVGYHVRHDIAETELEAIQSADKNMYIDKKNRKLAVWK